MLEKRTILDQIEINRTGRIGIRFAVQVVEIGEEDEKVISQEWHRTGLEPSTDIAAQLKAVDDDLIGRDKAKIKVEDVALVTQVVGDARTQKFYPTKDEFNALEA